MSIRWTMEAVWAAVAVVVTVGGGLYSHIFGAGAASSDIANIAAHQVAQDKRIDEHEGRLRTQEQDTAGEQATLHAIQDQLDRIEKKL
jgi:hypothetical protein